MGLCKGWIGSLLRPSDAVTWRPMNSLSTRISRPNAAALHKQQWMYRQPQAMLLPTDSRAVQQKPLHVFLPAAYRGVKASSPKMHSDQSPASSFLPVAERETPSRATCVVERTPRSGGGVVPRMIFSPTSDCSPLTSASIWPC